MRRIGCIVVASEPGDAQPRDVGAERDTRIVAADILAAGTEEVGVGKVFKVDDPGIKRKQDEGQPEYSKERSVYFVHLRRFPILY